MNTRRHGFVNKLCLLAGVLALSSLSAPDFATAAPHVFAWGDNSYGQSSVPPSLTNVIAVAAGYYDGMALRNNGTVLAWGDNTYGQTNNQPSLTNVMALDGGAYHSLALRSNSTVYAWGLNNYGQANVPAGLTNVIKVSAGGNHSMALRSNGTVIVWGDNSSTQTNVPSNATNVVAISAGDTHCLALRGNGSVVAWGDNDSGQSTVPANVTNIMAIAAGYHHNLAVRSNGTVVAWGVNVYGETDVPPGLSNVIAVAAGDFHSAALRADGTVIAWGQDFEGVTNVPAGLNSVTLLAGGFDFDLALSLSSLCPPGFPDNFECRQTLIGSSVSLAISNVGATREPGEPQHFTAPTSNSIWFTWTAPSSGGVVVAATNSDFSLTSPVLAVYTGSTLASLVRISSNSADFYVARTVFTAVAGQTYQIVFDGIAKFDSGQGTATLTLNLSPPPANDLFVNATTIIGNYFTSAGSFVGASRETSEPAHSDPTLGQTLWWNWTAPTNGPTPLSVRLMADGVSFPPGVGVYTGNSVASLTAVTFTMKTNGMSSDAIFNATPGTTYHLALAGLESDPNSTAPLIGSYHFRLNCRGFALTITNTSSTTNGAGAVSFTANAVIQNLGATPSGPVRVSISAVSGLSTTQPLSSAPTSTVINLGIFPSVPTNLAAGQSVMIPVSGVVPAPFLVNSDASTPYAYGAYAELQEQPSANQWFTVDETLISFDDWPGIGEIFGPGGGVIRLDPGYIGTSAFNPLAAVTVIGPTTVIEGSPTAFSGQARYYNGFTYNFTNTTWLATLFNITTNGMYTSGSVTSNTTVTLTAEYSDSGFAYDAPTNITIINLPPPLLQKPGLSGVNFTLQISGVSNRVHVVEATTNLSPPAVWQPVGTNTIGANGLWNFTNGIGSSPQRFYRAREVP